VRACRAPRWGRRSRRGAEVDAEAERWFIGASVSVSVSGVRQRVRVRTEARQGARPGPARGCAFGERRRLRGGNRGEAGAARLVSGEGSGHDSRGLVVRGSSVVWSYHNTPRNVNLRIKLIRLIGRTEIIATVVPGSTL
jgi:hypothetical protein